MYQLGGGCSLKPSPDTLSCFSNRRRGLPVLCSGMSLPLFEWKPLIGYGESCDAGLYTLAQCFPIRSLGTQSPSTFPPPSSDSTVCGPRGLDWETLGCRRGAST